MENYKGFRFRPSANTGGKAGKDRNVTTSFHVTSPTYCKGRYFSYDRRDKVAFGQAIVKARKWVDKIINRNEPGTP